MSQRSSTRHTSTKKNVERSDSDNALTANQGSDVTEINYYYSWTRACLMVLGFYICLYIFIQHLKSEKNPPNDNKPIDISFLYSIMLNTCSLRGGVICFGKPFCPAGVYTFGIAYIAFTCRENRELAEWMEKLTVISSVLSLMLEYFYAAFKYWVTARTYEDMKFIIMVMIVGLLVFILVVYQL